ncbi:MAG TPA: hypothetical protein PLB18_07490 [Acidobacteriota bacterium]|nr:hypothetical protein [Acidobacteriota bacterium]HND19200.1 hypothetical protein [Acidobacteriota bacterium]
MKNRMGKFSLVCVVGWLVSQVLLVSAIQEKSVTPSEETTKAKAVLQQAIEALGGKAFEGVKSEVSRGFYMPYQDGQPNNAGFFSFVDYLVYPDKERVEFKNRKHRLIQTNVGNTGWRFDSETTGLKDQTPDQITRFKQDLRCQLDILLKFEQYRSDVQFRYEARVPGIVKFEYAEAVIFLFPDGDQARLLIDQATHRPLAVQYTTQSPDGKAIKRENRFLQYKSIGSVWVPYVLEQYVDGKPLNRITYEERKLNAPVSEKLFVKPADAKHLDG